MSKIPGLTGIRINADDDNEHVIISLTESDEPKDKSEEPEFFTTFKVHKEQYMGLIGALIVTGIDLQKMALNFICRCLQRRMNKNDKKHIY